MLRFLVGPQARNCSVPQETQFDHFSVFMQSHRLSLGCLGIQFTQNYLGSKMGGQLAAFCGTWQEVRVIHLRREEGEWLSIIYGRCLGSQWRGGISFMRGQLRMEHFIWLQK